MYSDGSHVIHLSAWRNGLKFPLKLSPASDSTSAHNPFGGTPGRRIVLAVARVGTTARAPSPQTRAVPAAADTAPAAPCAVSATGAEAFASPRAVSTAGTGMAAGLCAAPTSGTVAVALAEPESQPDDPARDSMKPVPVVSAPPGSSTTAVGTGGEVLIGEGAVVGGPPWPGLDARAHARAGALARGGGAALPDNTRSTLGSGATSAGGASRLSPVASARSGAVVPPAV